MISENAESILLEKKKLLAILQVEEDDLDEMMEKIIDDIIRSQIEIIEKEHKKTGFKIVSIFEDVYKRQILYSEKQLFIYSMLNLVNLLLHKIYL